MAKHEVSNVRCPDLYCALMSFQWFSESRRNRITFCRSIPSQYIRISPTVGLATLYCGCSNNQSPKYATIDSCSRSTEKHGGERIFSTTGMSTRFNNLEFKRLTYVKSAFETALWCRGNNSSSKQTGVQLVALAIRSPVWAGTPPRRCKQVVFNDCGPP